MRRLFLNAGVPALSRISETNDYSSRFALFFLPHKRPRYQGCHAAELLASTIPPPCDSELVRTQRPGY